MKVTIVTQPFSSQFYRVKERQGRTKKGSGILAYLGTTDNKPPGYDKLLSAAQLVFDDIQEWSPKIDDLAKLDPDFLDVAHTAVTEQGCSVLFDEQQLQPFATHALNKRIEGEGNLGLRQLGKQTAKFARMSEDSESFRALRKALLPLDELAAASDERMLLTPDPVVNRHFVLQLTNLSPDNILMALAVSGVEVTLPSIGVPNSDVLHEIKERHKADRDAYISALRKYVKDCYERVKHGDYEDAWQYAQFASNQELLAACHDFELAVASTNKDLLKRLAIGFTEGIPRIAGAMLKGSGAALSATYIEVLKVLCTSMAKHTLEKDLSAKFPGVSYIYELRKSLSNIG